MSLQNVNIDNFPTTYDVRVTNPSINVGNFPATQDDVRVTNFPTGEGQLVQAGFSRFQMLLIAGLTVGVVYSATKEKIKV